ncbi:MAG: hypothetical protein ACLUHA_01855 [Bacteroides stercoris]
MKADSINCYGSEFDVWLTADNQLVVNHDSTFKGVNMQKSTTTVYRRHTGQREQLPTLRQYLEKAGQLKRALFWNTKIPQDAQREAYVP